jgi:hypothetical protein
MPFATSETVIVHAERRQYTTDGIVHHVKTWRLGLAVWLASVSLVHGNLYHLFQGLYIYNAEKRGQMAHIGEDYLRLQ